MSLLALGFAFGSGRKDADKLAPYECGFEAFEDSRMRFDVRYYLVAILFIIFDLEIAFLFPWAVSLDRDRPLRARGHGDLPRRARRRIRLRVAQGSSRVGLNAATELADSTCPR